MNYAPRFNSFKSQTTSRNRAFYSTNFINVVVKSTPTSGITCRFCDENGDSWEEYVVYHHKFITWMETNGYDTSKNYSSEELQELVSESPYYKATSNDVDWLQKVKMQGRVQKWVDHSISVTINLPSDVSEELVGQLYIEAWKSGCKGCTVYRDGSRAGVLVSNDKEKSKDKNSEEDCYEMPQVVTKRPTELEADVIKF